MPQLSPVCSSPCLAAQEDESGGGYCSTENAFWKWHSCSEELSYQDLDKFHEVQYWLTCASLLFLPSAWIPPAICQAHTVTEALFPTFLSLCSKRCLYCASFLVLCFLSSTSYKSNCLIKDKPFQLNWCLGDLLNLPYQVFVVCWVVVSTVKDEQWGKSSCDVLCCWTVES